MFEHRAKRLIGVCQNVGKYAEKAHYCKEIDPGRSKQSTSSSQYHTDAIHSAKASHAEIDIDDSIDKLLRNESVDRTVTTKGYSGSFEPLLIFAQA